MLKKVCTFIALMLIPLLIALGVSADWFKWATNSNDWIDFWGSYVGAIVGGLVTLFVMKYTIKKENEMRESDAKQSEELHDREEKIEYFDKLIELSALYLQNIGNLCADMTRCMKSKTNEFYHQTLHSINLISGLSIQIEIMIETREDVYDLMDLNKMFKTINNQINEISDEYDNLARIKFCNNDRTDVLSKKMDDILDILSVEIQECIKNTVKNNLYKTN